MARHSLRPIQCLSNGRLGRIPEPIRFGTAAFIIGMIVRSIPNLVAGMPIGYDTPLYAVHILDWKYLLSDTNALFRSPLLSFILGLFYEMTHVDPFVMLDATQPLLYGLLAASFYVMSELFSNPIGGLLLLLDLSSSDSGPQSIVGSSEE